MLKEIDQYFDSKLEPVKGCLLALRNIILSHDDQIEEVWKYRMPFFCYRGRMFCYLWVDKKLNMPYIGVMGGKRINHPKLITTKNTKVKKLMIAPNKDIPIEEFTHILDLAVALHQHLPKVKSKS